MTKLEYNNYLTFPQWKRKRKLILIRDGFKCRKCGCTTDLQVHHKWYIQGALPWEVPNYFLITLCRECHESEHEGRPISSFIRKLPIEKKKRKNRKKSKPKKNEEFKLKGRDKILQKRYDNLRIKFGNE